MSREVRCGGKLVYKWLSASAHEKRKRKAEEPFRALRQDVQQGLALRHSVERQAQLATLRSLVELELVPPGMTNAELEARIGSLAEVGELDELWRLPAKRPAKS